MKQVLLKVILGRVHRSRTITQQSPHYLQWNAPNSPQNCPFPFNDHQPPSNTPIPQPTPLTTPTASGSNQPFCHNTLSGQTDCQTNRLTDGIGDNSIPRALTLYCIDWERRARKRCKWQTHKELAILIRSARPSSHVIPSDLISFELNWTIQFSSVSMS